MKSVCTFPINAVYPQCVEICRQNTNTLIDSTMNGILSKENWVVSDYTDDNHHKGPLSDMLSPRVELGLSRGPEELEMRCW